MEYGHEPTNRFDPYKKKTIIFHVSSHSVLHNGRGAVALSPSWLLPIELNHPLQCFWTLVTLVNHLRYHSDHQLQPWLFVLYCYAFVCFNVIFYGFYHIKPPCTKAPFGDIFFSNHPIANLRTGALKPSTAALFPQDQPLPQAAPADRPLVHWPQKGGEHCQGDGWGWTTWFSGFFLTIGDCCCCCCCCPL